MEDLLLLNLPSSFSHLPSRQFNQSTNVLKYICIYCISEQLKSIILTQHQK